ncbi:VWA domain-containing protein, partial [Mycobacterium sp.]|uniref:VWA domain-containing protein n=1 Tax=Mycobacterium sp. TaxID=1785 RepID=UPI002D7F6EBF
MTASDRCRQLVGGSALFLASPGGAVTKVDPPTWQPPKKCAARPISLPSLAGALPNEVRQLAARVKAVYVADDSGSMYGSFGDPTGVRYAAAQSLVELQRRSGGGQASVVHWGSDAPEEMATPLVDVRRGRRQLDDALQIPPTLGGNDLPAALRRAMEVLSILGRSDIPLVFVLSDGIEFVTSEVHAAVAALPKNAVHMVLVDRSNGCSPDMEKDWAKVAFGS